jgi:hypothetical protein
MTLAYAAVLLVVPWGSKMPTGTGARVGYVLSNLLMLPSISAAPTILAVSWAIGSVVYAYVVIGLAYDLLGVRQWRRMARVGAWLAIGGGLVWLGLSGGSQRYGFDFLRLSGFACGALGAELWTPLGTWRANSGDSRFGTRCVGMLRRLAGLIFGDWFRRTMELAWVRAASRFGARWAYHTLLTQGIALHSIRLVYPFGKAPGLLDLLSVVVLALLLSHGLGWVLAECEKRCYRTAVSLWRRLRSRPLSHAPQPIANL